MSPEIVRKKTLTLNISHEKSPSSALVNTCVCLLIVIKKKKALAHFS